MHLEGAEDHKKDEKIVHAERFFDDVAGKIFQPALRPMPVPDEIAESDRQGNPCDAPKRGFTNVDLAGSAVEYTQVQGDDEEDKKIEACPQQRGAHGRSITQLPVVPYGTS